MNEDAALLRIGIKEEGRHNLGRSDEINTGFKTRPPGETDLDSKARKISFVDTERGIDKQRT